MSTWTNDPERIVYFGMTHTRGKYRAFGIRAKDRDKHVYAIGKSGMGKSTLLENMAVQDIQNGEGMIFIDPHGSTAEKLLDFIPEDRIKDTMYLAPFDTDNPIGFNILEDVGYDKRHKVVAGLMGVFERIWADSWSARMQYILQNTLFALLEYPGATIIDVNRMLVNKAFREEVVKHITDPVVGAFWREEFANYGDKYTQEATPAIQNKIGQFVSNPLIRNILGQAKSTFDFREMMDQRKIVIINLSKGRMGEANSTLLGSMLVIKVYLSALSRAEESASDMRNIPPCYFYVDEFQNVVNKAFENILSESRKYKLCLTIANQYIEQMPEEVRNAVFGNVGTTIIFRVGPMDAQFLEPVFGPTFLPEDMVGLGRGEIYLNLMIDGVGSAPFSAQTLPPIEEPGTSFREKVIAYTRERYGLDRAKVEKEIAEVNERWFVAAKEKHKESSAGGQSRSFGAGRSQGGYQRRDAPRDDRSREYREPMPPREPPVTPAPRPPEVPKVETQVSVAVPTPTPAPAPSVPPQEYRPPREEYVRPVPQAPHERRMPDRSPADMLRTMRAPTPAPAPRPQPVAPVPARPKQEEVVHRNALKDAIASAQKEKAAAPTPVPTSAPRPPQQQVPPRPVSTPPAPVQSSQQQVPPRPVSVPQPPQRPPQEERNHPPRVEQRRPADIDPSVIRNLLKEE